MIKPTLDEILEKMISVKNYCKMLSLLEQDELI